jgi:hypothetical protein
MGLRKMVAEIEAGATDYLREAGLTVVGLPADDIDGDDDTIAFRSAEGRAHVVEIQVNSMDPTWRRSCINVNIHETKDIPGSEWKTCGLEAVEFGPELGSNVTANIASLLAKLREHEGEFEPVASMEDKIVTETAIAYVHAAMRAAALETGASYSLDIYTERADGTERTWCDLKVGDLPYVIGSYEEDGFHLTPETPADTVVVKTGAKGIQPALAGLLAKLEADRAPGVGM